MFQNAIVTVRGEAIDVVTDEPWRAGNGHGLVSARSEALKTATQKRNGWIDNRFIKTKPNVKNVFDEGRFARRLQGAFLQPRKLATFTRISVIGNEIN